MTRKTLRRRSQRESGQAVVEAVLTLPLIIFLVLGTTQLFMMLQARIMAQYAAYKAVRIGSLSKGNCDKMTQAAAAAVLPAVTNTNGETEFFNAYNDRLSGGIPVYNTSKDGFSAPIVQIVRESPLVGDIKGGGSEDVEFDDFTRGANAPYSLEIRMAFWYRMRIPFANWVISRIFMAHYGLQSAPTTNPFLRVQKNPNWSDGKSMLNDGAFPGGSLTGRMKSLASSGVYVFPIQVNAAMPMMTPPSRAHFSAACP